MANSKQGNRTMGRTDEHRGGGGEHGIQGAGGTGAGRTNEGDLKSQRKNRDREDTGRH